MPLNKYRAQQPARVNRFVLDFSDLTTFDDAAAAFARVGQSKQQLALVGQLVATDLNNEWLPVLLTDLREYPPEAPPGNFWANAASDKQRRYVMMLIRQGKWTGRTGALARGWRAHAEFRSGSRGGIIVTVENVAQNERGEYYAPYVMGNIGLGKSERQIRRYQMPMQKFHQITGWHEAHAIVQPAYEQMREYALEAWVQGAQDVIDGVLTA